MSLLDTRTSKLCFFVCFSLLCGIFFVQAEAQSSESKEPVPRQTIFLSDLHLGEGTKSKSDDWLASEDARWGDDLKLFLETIESEDNTPTDLVLNGDVFELWQSATPGCSPSDPTLGCREEEVIARLRRIVESHPIEIKAIRTFAETDHARVFIVPGDHDAALLLPNVAKAALSLIGAPDDKIQIMPSGTWQSDDGLLYSEHGHQINNGTSSFEHWPTPFIKRDGGTHLLRNWEERFIQKIYNDYEERYPIIDNVSQLGLGIKYLLAADPSIEIEVSAGQLLRYFLFKMPWTQYRSNLEEEVQPPQWDIEKIRLTENSSFLVESLPADDPFRNYAATALEKNHLAFSLSDLSDEELVAICDHRAILRRARRRLEQTITQLVKTPGPAPRECPRQENSFGGVYSEFFRSRNNIFSRYLGEVQQRGDLNDTNFSTFKAFIYSHTHLPDRGFYPTQNTDLRVINTGAWQRTIYPRKLEQLRNSRKIPTNSVLSEIRPKDLPSCYAFVQIAPYTTTPKPVVQYWRLGGTNEWGIAGSCQVGY